MKGAGCDDRLPIFVVGMPRSGTTLLEQTLNRHQRVRGLGELMDIDGIAHAIAPSNRSQASYPAAMKLLSPVQAAAFGSRYVEKQRERIGADDILRIVDKNPFNFRYVGLINAILRAPAWIHIQRHPLDTCLSCYFQPFFGQELSFSWSLQHTAAYYAHYRELMRHWDKVLPGRVLNLQYQSLVQDPETALRRVLDFCGLKWDPSCLDSSLQDSAIRTASVEQARKPIYQDSLERWRRYEAHVGALRDSLKKYL